MKTRIILIVLLTIIAGIVRFSGMNTAVDEICVTKVGYVTFRELDSGVSTITTENSGKYLLNDTHIPEGTWIEFDVHSTRNNKAYNARKMSDVCIYCKHEI